MSGHEHHLTDDEAAATFEPSGETTQIDPRWTDSTRSPRVTSTSTGGAEEESLTSVPGTG